MPVSELEKKAERKIRTTRRIESELIDASSKAVNLSNE
jgi:hypothetical protein